VSDVDALGAVETITVSVGEGTLHAVAGNSGVIVDSGDNTSSVQIFGTLAQLNAFLGSGGTSNLTYVDNLGTPAASTTLTLAINDGGNTGSGGAKPGSATAPINIAAVNDAPVFANLDNSPGFLIGGPGVVLDGNATVSDVELDALNNYSGAVLTLARDGGASRQCDEAPSLTACSITSRIQIRYASSLCRSTIRLVRRTGAQGGGGPAAHGNITVLLAGQRPAIIIDL
jgi:hypothetical protein